MKHIDSEDPRLTAYALGELPEHEAAVLRRLAEDDPALHAALAETNALAGLIRSGFGRESLELGEDRREAIRRAGRSPGPENVVSMQVRRRDWLRPAAVAAVAAGLVACVLWVLQQIPVGENQVADLPEGNESGHRETARVQILLRSAPRSARPMAGGAAPLPGTSGEDVYEAASEVPSEIAEEERLALQKLWRENPEAFIAEVKNAARKPDLADLGSMDFLQDNPFISAEEEPRSMVPIVSGRASYHLVERFIRRENTLPPRNSVRTEELINHVSYAEEGGADLGGIKLAVEIAVCPWDSKMLLMGVLLRNESEKFIAGDTVLQLEVEPDLVRSYRLIGYASRRSGEDAGGVSVGLPPGRSNYALYHLRPSVPEKVEAQQVVARVSLNTGTQGGELVVPVTNPPRNWSMASNNLRTAVALSAWGMVLRQSPFGGPLTHLHVGELAQGALDTSDPSDLKRREALQLVLDALPLFEVDPDGQGN